jgi:carbon-monoxide dehydrogenase medium subunit
MWSNVIRPLSLEAALETLAREGANARLVAGGTDVLVELQRGIKLTETLIDLSALRGLDDVRLDGETVVLGGLATHNDLLAAPFARTAALPLAQACIEVGAPQIRARGTIAGNLVTASPANDTIAPLLALDAELTLTSASGERTIALAAFFKGFRSTELRADELVREIRFRALGGNRRGIFLKLGLRRAQAISVIDIAVVLTFADNAVPANGTPAKSGTVLDARIALGCLAPTVIRATTAEAFLIGKRLDKETRAEAGRFACGDAAPISDIRGTADYRLATLEHMVADALERLADGHEADGYPERPVLLQTPVPAPSSAHASASASMTEPPPFDGTHITATINGERRTLTDAVTKNLLDALRDNAGLTGSKEGCGEGECGACTVWLDGAAVMSCLVPATQAHGATITTIEGLAAISPIRSRSNGASLEAHAQSDELHPLQQAYIDHGAVQCGFCIPGMLMSGAKLLEEHDTPTLAEHQSAISGNLCRCTGYKKILEAMQDAAAQLAAHEPQPHHNERVKERAHQ